VVLQVALSISVPTPFPLAMFRLVPAMIFVADTDYPNRRFHSLIQSFPGKYRCIETTETKSASFYILPKSEFNNDPIIRPDVF
jgi:hypothetical protein